MTLKRFLNRLRAPQVSLFYLTVLCIIVLLLMSLAKCGQ